MKRENPFVHNPPAVFEAVDGMSSQERETESELLKDALTYHTYRRSVLREPEISDEEYLSLMQRLEDLERKRLEEAGRDPEHDPALERIRALSSYQL